MMYITVNRPRLGVVCPNSTISRAATEIAVFVFEGKVSDFKCSDIAAKSALLRLGVV